MHWNDLVTCGLTMLILPLDSKISVDGFNHIRADITEF